MAPRKVWPRRALRDGPDAVEPVVGGAEVAAGVADDGNVEGLQGGEDVGAEAGGGVHKVNVCVVRVVDAAVDTTAHVFGEAGVDVPVDFGEAAGRVDGEGCVLGGGGACGGEVSESCHLEVVDCVMLALPSLIARNETEMTLYGSEGFTKGKAQEKNI